MAEDHIHLPGDGRGARLVYVDGELISQVIYADTREGIVRYHGHPAAKQPDGVNWVVRERRGKVEVEPVDG